MRHSILRDGLIAGALGATAVAAWFLILDVSRGQPFYTPTELGRTLLSVLGTSRNDPALLFIVAYTVFHYVAFIAVASLAAVFVHWGHSQPGVLAGAFILFVAIEIGFYGWTAVMAESPILGVLAWPQVAIGNAIAAVLMGTYLWRSHPELGKELDLALSGRPEG